jgi:hypothetical protein
VSILDTALLVGKEATYGTAATLTRAYEAHADAWKFDQAQIDSTGFRAGIQALRSDRSRVVAMGAEGTIECDFLTLGMGLLLDAGFGATTGPTTVGTTGKQYIFTTTSAEPATSLTVQMQRAKADGGVGVYTFAGAVAKTFKLSQAVGDGLMVAMDFDAQSESTVTAAGTPVYPVGASPFIWADAAMTVNSVSVDSTSFEFNIDHQLNTDRRYLRGSALKRRPRRNGLPVMSGQFEYDYVDDSLQNLYVAGTIVPVSITWTGGIIGAGPATFSATLALAACQLTGDDPQASMTDLTKATMGYRVLDPGTGAAATLTVTTSDAAL